MDFSFLDLPLLYGTVGGPSPCVACYLSDCYQCPLAIAAFNRPRLARLAPTPSGFLHWGNAANFLLNARLAGPNGRLLLRIDDLDRARFREEYLADIFRVIDRLGIVVADGPANPADFHANWTQTRRLPAYNQALEQLAGNSDRLFACLCSRKELAAGQHAHGCLSGAIDFAAAGVAWRINVRGLPPVVVPDLVRQEPFVVDLDATVSDFAVRRKDGTPAYQLASVVDDYLFGVTAVGRGQDLLPSTAAQSLLADLLGYEPLFGRVDFLHHPLLRAENGEKLSKSAGAAGGAESFTPAVVAELSQLVEGWL